MKVRSPLRRLRLRIMKRQAIRSMLREWRAADVGFLAGGMAFFTALSLVPFLAVVLSIAEKAGRLSFNAGKVEKFVLRYLAPPEATDLVSEFSTAIHRLSDELIGVGGLVVGFFVLSGLLRRLDTTVQRIWNSDERISSWRLLAIFLTVVFVLIPLTVLSLGGLLNAFPSGDTANTQFIVFAVTALLVLGIYRFMPRSPVALIDAIGPALAVAVLLMLGKTAYVWATRNIFNYNRIYGSLAALPLFLVWIYILWWILLSGTLATKLVRKLRLRTMVD